MHHPQRDEPTKCHTITVYIHLHCDCARLFSAFSKKRFTFPRTPTPPTKCFLRGLWWSLWRQILSLPHSELMNLILSTCAQASQLYNIYDSVAKKNKQMSLFQPQGPLAGAHILDTKPYVLSEKHLWLTHTHSKTIFLTGATGFHVLA